MGGAYFIPKTEYPALELFLPIYVETWVGDRFHDEWEATRSFVAEEDELGPRLSSEIQQILTSGPSGLASETDLEAWFSYLGASACDPRPYGYEYREWLLEIAHVSQDPTYAPAPRPMRTD